MPLLDGVRLRSDSPIGAQRLQCFEKTPRLPLIRVRAPLEEVVVGEQHLPRPAFLIQAEETDVPSLPESPIRRFILPLACHFLERTVVVRCRDGLLIGRVRLATAECPQVGVISCTDSPCGRHARVTAG